METILEHLNISFFKWINAGAGKHLFIDWTAIFFSETGPYILGLSFVVAWFLVDERKRIVLLEATEAGIFGLLVNQVIGLFYFHPRPFMRGLCIPLIPHSPETSFPSDHATLLFSASIYLLIRRRSPYLGVFLFSVAIITAWARVYCGIHFPFDMVGSLMVGIISAIFIFGLSPYLENSNKWLIRLYEKLMGAIYAKVLRRW